MTLDGKPIPHSLYDRANNHGHINLNTRHDTSELCRDSIALWWEQRGRAAYPQAQRLLILCDGGGSHSATRSLFREDLQRLAARLKLGLRVAHYPALPLQNNPIEHRLFPPVTRACHSPSLEIAQQFIERAKTTAGLNVTTAYLDKVYATGRKYADNFKNTMKTIFDDPFPKWNYRAVPPHE